MMKIKSFMALAAAASLMTFTACEDSDSCASSITIGSEDTDCVGITLLDEPIKMDKDIEIDLDGDLETDVKLNYDVFTQMGGQIVKGYSCEVDIVNGSYGLIEDSNDYLKIFSEGDVISSAETANTEDKRYFFYDTSDDLTVGWETQTDPVYVGLLKNNKAAWIKVSFDADKKLTYYGHAYVK